MFPVSFSGLRKKICALSIPSSVWAWTDVMDAPLTCAEGVVVLIDFTELLNATTTWGRSVGPLWDFRRVGAGREGRGQALGIVVQNRADYGSCGAV